MGAGSACGRVLGSLQTWPLICGVESAELLKRCEETLNPAEFCFDHVKGSKYFEAGPREFCSRVAGQLESKCSSQQPQSARFAAHCIHLIAHLHSID